MSLGFQSTETSGFAVLTRNLVEKDALEDPLSPRHLIVTNATHPCHWNCVFS